MNAFWAAARVAKIEMTENDLMVRNGYGVLW